MSFFSRKKAEKVPINQTENYQPVLSDIIDLRAARQKTAEHSAVRASEHEAKNKLSFLSNENQKNIQNFFRRKSNAETKNKKSIFFNIPRITLNSKIVYAIIGTVFTLILIAILVSTVFSWATVVIEPKSENLKLEGIAITVDPALALPDTSTKRIPGETIEYSEEAYVSLKTTGERNTESKARGIITIKNLSATQPQTLVATTRFQDSVSGKIVRLTSGVTIPEVKKINGKIIPSDIDVEVIANEAGEEYNNLKGPFTIPGFKGTAKFQIFKAVIKEAMAKGMRGNSKVATAEDIAKAEIMFINEAKRALEEKRNASLPKGFKIIQNAERFEIVSKNMPRAGDPGNNIIIKGKARITNVAFQEKTLLEFLNSLINKEDADLKSSIAEKTSLAYDAAKLNQEGKLNFIVSGDLHIAWLINRSLVATIIAGKSIEEAKNELLSIEGIRTLGIKLFPFWKKTLPRDIRKLNVKLSES